MRKLYLIAMPFFVLAVMLATGCTNSPANKGEKVYDVKGKVVSIDAEKKKVTLDHEAIPGFMAAMTMPFDIENAKLLEGLKAGDLVHGKLKSKDGKHTLTELTKQ